jgi:predicted dehydrogenase
MLSSVAIVGLGSIGRRHIRLLSEIRQDIEVIVVRSGYGDACEEEKLASKIVYSIDEALNLGIQAAIISSPATLHLEQSLELAKKGVHLLIEKPVSHTSDRLDDLLKITRNNELVIMVGYVLRYDPGAIKFKKWLNYKKIGKILNAKIECGSYLPEWRPGQDYRDTVSSLPELGGGVLLELSHELDYLHWFFGKPYDMQADVRNSGTLDIDVEDQADLLMKSKQGFPVSVHIDFNRRFAERKCRVLTTKGELIWDAVQKSVTWREANKELLVYKYDNERDYIYKMQLKTFIDCIEKNNNPIITLEDGINVVKTIDTIRNASLHK